MIHRKATGLIPLAVLAVMSFMTLGFGPGDGPLVFADEEPLELTWSQAQAGTDIVVCNIGQEDVTNFRASLISYGFPEGRDLLEPAEVAETERSLEPDQCASVQVRLKPGAERPNPQLYADPVEYKGGLVASATNAGDEVKIVRDLAISVPEPEEVEENAARSLLPIRDDWRTARLHLPLDMLEYPDGSLPYDDDENAPLGTLLNGDTEAVVYANGPPIRQDLDTIPQGGSEPGSRVQRAVELPVRITDLKTVGDYSGTLTLAGVGDVEVRATVGDRPHWGLVALVVGLLAAALPIFYFQRFGPRWDLRLRCSRLERDYGRAADAFEGWFQENYGSRRERESSDSKDSAKTMEPARDYAPPDGSSIRTYCGSFKKTLKKYGEGHLLFDPASEDYRKLLEMLETAEQDARCFGNLEGRGESEFGESLKGLGVELEEFARFLREEFPVGRAPVLAGEAANNLVGGRLAVGGARKRRRALRITRRRSEAGGTWPPR